MKELQKKILNYELTFSYIQEALENANTLSSELLKQIDFKTGNLFTLLPEGSNLERLYEFKEGIILPQNPVVQYEHAPGHKSSYSIIPMIRDELSVLLRDKIFSEDLSCIFDNFIGKEPLENMPSSIARFYQNESYFVIQKENIRDKEISAKLVHSCLDISDAFWHSLGVLTRIDIRYFEDEKLCMEDIVKICQNAELIFVGAYDGEGYIFWEKKEGFFP